MHVAVPVGQLGMAVAGRVGCCTVLQTPIMRRFVRPAIAIGCCLACQTVQQDVQQVWLGTPVAQQGSC